MGYIVPLSLLTIVALSSAEFVLRPKDPPLNIEKLEETPGQPLVLRCVAGSGQKWLFNGADLAHGSLIADGTDSIVNITSFDPKLHSGVYECYQDNLSASVRVESNVDPPLPTGYRPCSGEQNNHCTKGSCGVDSHNNVACFCPPGWSGVKCDTPHDKVILQPKETDCIISIGGVLLTIIIIACIILLTFFFCPIGKCKRRQTQPERCPSLLEKGQEL